MGAGPLRSAQVRAQLPRIAGMAAYSSTSTAPMVFEVVGTYYNDGGQHVFVCLPHHGSLVQDLDTDLVPDVSEAGIRLGLKVPTSQTLQRSDNSVANPPLGVLSENLSERHRRVMLLGVHRTACAPQ